MNHKYRMFHVCPNLFLVEVRGCPTLAAAGILPFHGVAKFEVWTLPSGNPMWRISSSDGGFNMLLVHNIWLVVWNMNFMTFHILGISSSQLTNSYFSEGLKPPTIYVNKWFFHRLESFLLNGGCLTLPCLRIARCFHGKDDEPWHTQICEDFPVFTVYNGDINNRETYLYSSNFKCCKTSCFIALVLHLGKTLIDLYTFCVS